MNQFFITYDVVRHGWQVQRWHDGIYKGDVGPVWPEGRDARRYVDTLDAMPATSPLREREQTEQYTQR